jgi:hypothetical protein
MLSTVDRMHSISRLGAENWETAFNVVAFGRNLPIQTEWRPFHRRISCIDERQVIYMTVIELLLSAGVLFSERHVYLRGWGSHRARLNESQRH